MTSSSKPLSILISGGGIAGPSLAFWLSKTRLNPKPLITVLERAPEPRTQGQSIDIRGAAVKVMKQMGLESAILSYRTPERGTTLLNEAGDVIAQFESTGDSDRQGPTSEYEILRADLARVFIDATKDLENVTYQFGRRIASIEQDDDGVDVTFTGDAPPQRYDLVIGADGMTSKTRPLMLGPDKPEYFNFLGGYFAFFSIPCDKQLDEPPLWRVFITHGGRNLSTRPHENPATTGAYLGLVTPDKKVDPEMEEARQNGVPAQKKVIRKRMENAGWQAKRLCDGMDAADDFYLSPLTQVKLPKWSKGRCIVLGDAAHAPTPITGVGTSLAMEGAYTLAGEIAKSPDDIAGALEKYESIFRPVVESFQKVMPGAPQILNPQTKFGVSVLRGFVGALYRTNIFKLFGYLPDFGGEDRTPPEYDWDLD